MNKKTVALSKEQYKAIIEALQTGFSGCKPNKRFATALVLEANLGIRISDICKLRLCDIVKDGERYRLDITEQKTQKKRTFTVQPDIYNYIKAYANDSNLKASDVLFPVTERAIQKQLAIACDWLGYEGISTHSFRKYFATAIYEANDCNIVLVQQLLQHSTAAVTQKYIGIQPKQIENALQNHIYLL